MSGAKVSVIGIKRDVTTTGAGEYWRVLAPGQYRLMAVGSRRRSREAAVTVSGREPVIVNLMLQ